MNGILQRVVKILITTFFLFTITKINGDIFEKEPKKYDSDLLIVSTIDGTIRAFDEKDGRELWSVNDSPLVSQSITNLEILENGQIYRLVPSLEGALFLVDSTAMRPLSFSAETLLSSSFQLSDNSLLVGAQENEMMSLDPLTGKILFNCTKSGCDNKKSETGDSATNDSNSTLRLVVRRRRNIVRSVDVQTGSEKWNFSMSHNDLATFLMSGEVSAPNHDFNEHFNKKSEESKQGKSRQKRSETKSTIEYTFNVHRGLILATERHPYIRILWRKELGVSLHKVWSLRGTELRQLRIITPGQPLTAPITRPDRPVKIPAKETDITNAVGPTKNSCPHNKVTQFSKDIGIATNDVSERHYIYFGHYNGQLYVQMEDREAMLRDYPLPPRSTGEEPRPSIEDEHSRQQDVERYVPPSGLYISSELSSRVENRGLTSSGREGDSVSVEAFGLIGNPTSWWFQSLLFGLLIFVIGHLLITRFYLHENAARAPSETQQGEGGEEEGNEVVATESAEVQTSIRPSQEAPNNGVTTSGVGRSLSSSHASSGPSGDDLSQSPSFESRYANEYTHIRCLGRGGFGVVFEASHNMDGRSYAIKRIAVKDTDDNLERLSREVKALAHLEHPGIVRYYMAWTERPPPGWQDARDKEMKLCSPCKDTDGVNATDMTSTDADISTMNTTNANIQESSLHPRCFNPGKRYSDSVEIIFANQPEFDPSSEKVLPRRRHLSRILSCENEIDTTDDADVDGSESSAFKSDSDSQSESPSGPRSNEAVNDNSFPEIVFQRRSEDSRSDKLKSSEVGVGETEDSQPPSELDNGVSSGPGRPPATKLYLYIAMELCAVESLKTWLEKSERPDRSTLFHMFGQMVDTVMYVHRSGFMHRDLKPSNIFFSRSDARNIKIGDFGLVAPQENQNLMVSQSSHQSGSSRDSSLSSVDDGLSGGDGDRRGLARTGIRHTNRVGTRLYMSPELEKGCTNYNAKVDVFSLGLILLELLVPFGTQMERVQSLVQAKGGKLPASLEEDHPDEAALIRRLLNREPADRPSCDEILEDPLVKSAFTDSQCRYRTYSTTLPSL